MTAPTTRATPKIALDQRAASRHDTAFVDAFAALDRGDYATAKGLFEALGLTGFRGVSPAERLKKPLSHRII
jgi:hypothetical protein